MRGGLKRNAGARRQEVLERAGAADRRAALGEQDGAAAAPDASAPGGKLRAGSLPRSPPGAGPRAPRGINSAVAMVRGVFDAGLNRTRTAVDALGPAVAAQLDATRTLLNRTLSGEGVATLLAPARDASRAALHRALNETRARGSADAALADGAKSSDRPVEPVAVALGTTRFHASVGRSVLGARIAVF